MKKICLVVTSRTQYGRLKILIDVLHKHSDVDLQLVCAGSALLPKYGDVVKQIEQEGIEVSEKITMLVEGGGPVAMAKTTGLGLIEFTTAFENLKPDIVIIRGDRYEMLAATVAASYLNIVIAHIEGGDVTGTIDESVRHAITKMAHVHFPTNNMSRDRIRRMGENPDSIFMVGSLDIEYLTHLDFEDTATLPDNIQKGLGAEIDLSEPYVVVLQHPVTSEYGQGMDHTEETIAAIEKIDMPVIWFWPNVDAGTDEISKRLRVARESGRLSKVHFYRFLPPELFVKVVNSSQCLIGNSSAGIKECSYLGVPVVNIGTRQYGRLRAENVKDVNYVCDEIYEAIKEQLQHGRYPLSSIYHRENTSPQLVDILVQRDFVVQKKWVD